jgi:Ca2+-binding EF-hand superfamily protein
MRKTVLMAALIALAPAALLAGTTPETPSSARGPGPGHEGDWFKRLDTNQDGAITKDEAQAANAERITKTFDTLDANKDGMITQDEMRAAHEARHAEMQAQFDARFKQADTNSDGLLSKDEAQKGMPRLAHAFDKLDANKDGQLSPEEMQAGREQFGRHRYSDGQHQWKGHAPDASAPALQSPPAQPPQQ